MKISNFKDADGYALRFDDNVTEEDQKYYMKEFPLVDEIAKHRVHCTTCEAHVGTAPISEKIVRTHPILGVTHCNKCFAFYVSYPRASNVILKFIKIFHYLFSFLEFWRVW